MTIGENCLGRGNGNKELLSQQGQKARDRRRPYRQKAPLKVVGSPEQAMFGSLLAAAAIRRPYMAGCADRIAFIGHERAVEAFLPAHALGRFAG